MFSGSSVKNNKVTDKLVKFVAGTNLPISILAKPEFVALCKELNPTVTLPSIKTFRTSVLPKAVILLKIMIIACKFYLFKLNFLKF